MPKVNIEKLRRDLEKLEAVIPQMPRQKDTVSKASVGWHIQHSLLVLSQVAQSLIISDPGNFKPHFSLVKTFFYTVRTIPRGKVKSPGSVQPRGEISSDSLQQQLRTIQEYLETVSRLPSNAFFKHPIFGDVNLRPAITFLVIHTRHHLKIIRDILAP